MGFFFQNNTKRRRLLYERNKTFPMWHHICGAYLQKLLGMKCDPNLKQSSFIVGDNSEIIQRKTPHFLHNGALEHRKIERDRQDYSEREDLGKYNFNAVIKC